MNARTARILALLALASASTARAQGGAQVIDTARAAAFDRMLRMAGLVEGGSITPRWRRDGSSFWYAAGAPANPAINAVDPRTGAATPLFDVPRLRRAVAAALGHEPPYPGVPFSTFTFVDGERGVRFSLEGRELRLDLATYEVTALPAPSPLDRDRTTARLVRPGYPTTGPDVYELRSPDGRWFATVQGHDLWLRSTADGRAEPLTAGGTEERTWDVAGASWSPDGHRLAAVRTDYRGVNRVPLLHWLKPVEEVEWRWFTKAGGPMPVAEPHLLDVRSKRAVPIDLGDEPTPYVALAGWTADGRTLFVLKHSRDHKRLRLFAVDGATGSARLVLTETQPTFIKGIGATPSWRELFTPLDDGKRFLWISERDGWDHLYLYDLDGRLIRRLTSGTWPVLEVVAVDSKQGWVYFTGHAERGRPYDTHVYRVNLDGSGFRRLTEGEGQHAPVFSPSREVFLDTHSSYRRPPVVELRAAAGRLIRTLSRGNADQLARAGWTPPEEVVVKAADDTTDLWGLVFKPLRFDSTRSYPVVEYIYGGPQTVNVPWRFAQGALPQAVAAAGFVVVVVDARGTPERGKAFQDVVYGRFGQQEIPDHAAALRQVAARRSYMDLSRVGIFGGSWGGYMTVRALVLAPEVYRVGVSIYPVVEMFDHAASAIEPYMGLPRENPAGYEAGSSLTRLDRFQGRLLLLHGTSDVNATFSATMKMVDGLTRAGKRYDLVVMPEQSHAPTGATRDYMLRRLWEYLVEHLQSCGDGPDGARRAAEASCATP